MSEKVTLVGFITIKNEERKRAEDLWQIMADDIAANEIGRVKFNLHYHPVSGQHVVIYEYASLSSLTIRVNGMVVFKLMFTSFATEKIRDEFMAKPLHVELGEKVKEEKLMLREPDMATEIRWVKPVLGSGR